MKSGIVLIFEHRSIMLSASLLTTLIVALSIAASPVEVRDSLITLPIARRLNISNGTINISQHDQARVDASPLDHRDFDIPTLNVGIKYTVAIGIGNIDTRCKFNLEREVAAANGLSYTDQLMIDTGSANTWIGAAKPYVRASTSVDLNQRVAVQDIMEGNQYNDTLIFVNNGVRITQQSIGVASGGTHLQGLDGILGIGPVALTLNSLTNQPEETIPTVTHNLYAQYTIVQELVSLSFEPMSANELTYGVIGFGAIDRTRYTGSIGWV